MNLNSSLKKKKMNGSNSLSDLQNSQQPRTKNSESVCSNSSTKRTVRFFINAGRSSFHKASRCVVETTNYNCVFFFSWSISKNPGIA